MESAGSPVWPPASFLLKMAKSSCLVCVCHCASVGGGGRGGGACLLSWDLEWVGTFLWIPFGLSTLTSEVSDFLPGAFLSFPPSPPPLFHLSITIWVLLLGTQPTRCRHAWQCCTGT